MPVLKVEYHSLVGLDGDVVDGAVPEFFVEDYGQGVQLTKFEHHAADGDGVCFHLVPLLLQCCQLGFGFFKAAAQFGVGGTVGFFGHSVGGIRNPAIRNPKRYLWSQPTEANTDWRMPAVLMQHIRR